MGQHHTLGIVRRPRGVENQRGIAAGGIGCGRVVGRRPEIDARHGVAIRIEQEQRHARQACNGVPCDLVARLRGDHPRRTAIGKQLGHLRRAVVGVQRDGDQAEPAHREVRRTPRRAVLREDRPALTRLRPLTGEERRGRNRHRAQLVVFHAIDRVEVLNLDGAAIGVLLRRLLERLVETGHSGTQSRASHGTLQYARVLNS